MKSITEYIKEGKDQIETKDVVNALKDSGETTQEIKQDVDLKQKYIGYKQLVTMFTKKCFEWSKGLGDLLKIVAKEEGNDFMLKNFGKDWVVEFMNKFKEFGESVVKLNKQLSEDVNESISVSKIKSYQDLYKLFSGLKFLDDTMVNWEKQHIKDNEFKILVDARKNVSDKIHALVEMSGKIKKLIDVTLDLMNQKV